MTTSNNGTYTRQQVKEEIMELMEDGDIGQDWTEMVEWKIENATAGIDSSLYQSYTYFDGDDKEYYDYEKDENRAELLKDIMNAEDDISSMINDLELMVDRLVNIRLFLQSLAPEDYDDVSI